MPTGASTQDLSQTHGPMVPMASAASPAPPTPRSQLARVLVGSVMAVVLGAGPAVAWDLSTQPPRAEPRSAWPPRSPWRAAGRDMKAALGNIARVYLPRDKPRPVDPAEGTAAASSAVVAPAPTPVIISPPPPRPPPHVSHFSFRPEP
jgi:hypothetical protein